MNKCEKCKYWNLLNIDDLKGLKDSSFTMTSSDFTKFISSNIWGVCLCPKIKRGDVGLNLEKGIPKIIIETEWHTPTFNTSKFFGCVLFESK